MIFVAVFASVFCTAINTVDAAESGRRQRAGAQKRAAIRAMPILERPSRPGHFYGNAVRRNASAKLKQSTAVASKPGIVPAVNKIKEMEAVNEQVKAAAKKITDPKDSKAAANVSTTAVLNRSPLPVGESNQRVASKSQNARGS